MLLQFRPLVRTGLRDRWPILAATALAFGTTGCDRVPQQSLRIATFNAALLSPPFRCANAIAIDCLVQSEGISEAWAEDLANRILADEANLDVILLNEVWDEDARKILVDRLSPSYPTQVRRIAKQVVDLDLSGIAAPIRPRIFGEDSGLMLFAKPEYNVLPLPNPALKWTGDDTTVLLDALDASTPEVAYLYYRNCKSEDCLASKGVALVRLRHRRGGLIHNIAFTHMQADPTGEPEKHAGIRQGQFDEIRSFLLTNFPDMPTRVLSGESFFLLGDLNVPFLNASGEWAGLFANTTGSFFSSALVEAWMTASSPVDRTPTNLVEFERLDHILYGPAPPLGAQTPASVAVEGRRPCVQHVTVPRSFVRHASDHSMVHADINLGDWYCRPREALGVNTDAPNDIVASPPGAGDTTRLRNPGAVQWFFVSDRDVATYSIGTDKPKRVSVEIYLPSNMSEPVSRYNKTAGKGLAPRGYHDGQFSTDIWPIEGPFFIKVRGKGRFTTANYNLAVRKHRCDTRQAACYLQPEKPHPARLSPDGELNPQHEAWFRFDVTGAPTSGGLQQVELAAALADGAAVSGELVDYFDASGAPALATTIDSTEPVRRWKGAAGTGASGYVRIRQGRPGPAPRTVTARLDPSIRFLNIFELVCEDETNPELGSDDIYSILTIDGVQRWAPAVGQREFDCDEPRDQHDWGAEVGLGTIAFADKVQIRLYEQDSPTSDDLLVTRELLAPAAGQMVRANGPAEWKFHGGHYRLHYETRRRENVPVADP